MSAGGIFKLITNDGKADKLILSTDLLEAQLLQTKDRNYQIAVKMGLDPSKEDLDATLAEIEETHIIHFQAKFKPYVAIGIEYQKLAPQSGGTQFGSQVTFSLAQFGDFFTDMALNINLSSTSYEEDEIPNLTATPSTITIPAASSSPLSTSVTNGYVTLGDGSKVYQINNEPGVIKNFSDVGNFLPNGCEINPTKKYSDSAYYCDFPGERMLRSVSFEVNGNPLDDYDNYSYVFYRNFKLPENKKIGYYKGAGQELPIQAYGQTMSPDGLRVGTQLFDGPQTPKLVQPPLQIWQKMLFWFNLDFSLALPSAAIPFGQRYIQINLTDVQQLVFRAASIFRVIKVTNQKYTDLEDKNPKGDGTYDLSSVNTTANPLESTWYQYLQVPVLTNGTHKPPTILSMNLYVNNIFTHPAVHDLYIKRIGFYLVRIHRRQRQAINQSDLNLLLNNFKFPVEYMFVGIIPDENTNGQYQATDWHQFSKIQHKQYNIGYLDCSTEDRLQFQGSEFLQWSRSVPAITDMEVTAHGVTLQQKAPSKFFNSYVPENFGLHTITTPKDSGALMINFALYPNVFQPSGHINISRAREFYVHVYSDTIGQPNESGQTQAGTLIIEGSAINFLLISDGSAVLRYST